MKSMRIGGHKTNTSTPRLTMNFSDAEVKAIHFAVENAQLDNPELAKMMKHFEEFINTEDESPEVVKSKKIYVSKPAMERE